LLHWKEITVLRRPHILKKASVCDVAEGDVALRFKGKRVPPLRGGGVATVKGPLTYIEKIFTESGE